MTDTVEERVTESAVSDGLGMRVFAAFLELDVVGG